MRSQDNALRTRSRTVKGETEVAAMEEVEDERMRGWEGGGLINEEEGWSLCFESEEFAIATED